MPRTGAIVCRECGLLFSGSEPKCPNCGAWNPEQFALTRGLTRWLRRFDLTFAVIVVCIALYVVSLLLDPSAIFRMRGIFDFLAPDDGALAALGMTGRFAMSQGRWWTVFNSIFLHGSVLHIAFNLAIGRQYLRNVAGLYGDAQAWIIFVIAGAVGFALSNVASGNPTIGASGSIFGLLGALIVYGRRTGQGHITQQLWISSAVMFAYGFLMPSVNNWAHAGGFAGGFVTAEFLALDKRRTPTGVWVVAGVLLLAVAGSFVAQGVWVARLLLR